ncbi:MAG TPA: transglycosylase SLT domain-containing protein [Elusimicrobiota bacterium]|nr:transglycosylase SLT domain-containing protein [Elusimicrobiota bacterium]
MRTWIAAALAGLALASPSSAQTAGVSVWLQLPKGEAASPARAQSADVLILKLLGPKANKETTPSKDGPLVHYRSPAWSERVPEFERRAELATLSASWGSALRVEEARTPAPALSALPRAFDQKAPTLDSALGLVPGSLLAGDHAGFYDGFKAAPGSAAEPVLGRFGSSSSLAPASPSAAPFAPKAEPPSPLGVPAVLAYPYSDLIEKAAKASGIDPALLKAVVSAKSGFDPKRAVAGGYGLMAISARSARIYGYTAQQMLDPQINLKVGSDILADLLKEFGGDVHRALAAYQVGPKEVLRSGGIPNDRSVRDFLNEVEVSLGPDARAAQIPVKTIRSPLKYAVQKDLIELAEQARKGTGVSRYRPIIEKMAAQFGVDPKLMEAMVMQEDPSGNPRIVSPAGAQGLAQLMPETAAQLGVKNAFDPVQSLRGMARHMRHLSEVFDGDKVLIAASYNSGEGTVERLGRVPRYKETMAYVRRVFNNYFALTDTKVNVEPYMPPPPRKARTRRRRNPAP